MNEMTTAEIREKNNNVRMKAVFKHMAFMVLSPDSAVVMAEIPLRGYGLVLRGPERKLLYLL